MTAMQLRDRDLSLATQAAEGLPRRRFTVAELEAMVAAGILDKEQAKKANRREGVPDLP